jgi:ufm1-conjugating enzyme 1
MVDSSQNSIVDKIPLLKTNAGPKDKDWKERIKEEYIALISYIKLNQEDDQEWFEINSLDESGIKWKGKCWYYHNFQKYEFVLQFEIPATYPASPIELELPELEGKTPKMYRGGKICLDIHFAPLWGKKSPKFGIAHALALALGPWLAAEIPYLVEEGIISA